MGQRERGRQNMGPREVCDNGLDDDEIEMILRQCGQAHV